MKEGEAEFFRKVWSQQKLRYGDFQRGPYCGIAYKVVDGIKRYVLFTTREPIDSNQALVALHDSIDKVTEERASGAETKIRSLKGEAQLHEVQKALELEKLLETTKIERIIIDAGEYIVKSKEAAKGGTRAA